MFPHRNFPQGGGYSRRVSNFQCSDTPFTTLNSSHTYSLFLHYSYLLIYITGGLPLIPSPSVLPSFSLLSSQSHHITCLVDLRALYFTHLVMQQSSFHPYQTSHSYFHYFLHPIVTHHIAAAFYFCFPNKAATENCSVPFTFTL